MRQSFAWIAMASASMLSLGQVARAEDSIEGKSLANIRQVTSGMQKAGEGYFSPDGQSIIYQAVPLDYMFYQIYTQPLSGPLSGGRPKLVNE